MWPRRMCETSRPSEYGVWGSSRPAVALEQQVGRARRGDPLVGVGLGQPVHLIVDREAAARLEDVVVEAEEARVVVQHRPRAARHRAHERAGPVARLERPDAEQREAALAVARHRPAGAEQRPVEVDVQAAHAGIVAGFSGRRTCACPAACRSGARCGARSRPTAATGTCPCHEPMALAAVAPPAAQLVLRLGRPRAEDLLAVAEELDVVVAGARDLAPAQQRRPAEARARAGRQQVLGRRVGASG